MKSTTTYPFIVVRGRYCMTNSLNLTTHNAICLAALGLLIALCKGLSVKMTTICAWKYNLTFRAAITNAKARFSIWGYLSSAPQSAQLVKCTGFYTPSSSLTKVALTAARETTRYRNSSSPSLDGLSIGREERNAFKSSNACWHSFVHPNDFLSMRKKGKH